MLFPSLFGEDLMDDYMDDMADLGREFDREFSKRNPLYGRRAKNVMKTDVTEKDGNFNIAVDLPGFKKDEIQLSLDNGYLTIQTNKGLNKEEKDKKGNVIRQERYTGNMARSFYVGDTVTEDDVHAKFEDGVLKITIPDKTPKEEIPKKSTIAIEG